MAKKSTTKTTKKKTAAAVKKVPAKKKTATKKKAKAKKSPFKSKLGHDPLAWITGDDATELGLSFDDIESSSSSSALDEIIPAVQVAEDSIEVNEVAAEPVSVIEQNVASETVADTAPPVSDDGSWGLFGSKEETPVTAQSETSDDGSWGLFGSEEAEASDSSTDEGIAWGLFEDELATDTDIDHDALTIHLPASFNVSVISKVYHEFEEIISKNHDVIVDASDIETIDAVGLQLLFAGRKELQKNGCKMVIKDGSKRVDLLSKSSFINELIGISG